MTGDETMVNPYDVFSKHAYIQTIAENEAWTVSTNDKMPVDMYALSFRHQIRGAADTEPPTVLSLSAVHTILPNASNFAYSLQKQRDDFVILDIEPKCPDNIKEKLLKIPALYREKSMSGKGIHLLLIRPDEILAQYPDADKKSVMKEQHGWYEVLIEHWVTFTANILPEPDTYDQDVFTQIFTDLCKQQKPPMAKLPLQDIEGINDDGSLDEIIRLVANTMQNYVKSPESFNNDMSRYESSVANYFHQKLELMMKASNILPELNDLTDAHKVWIVAKALEMTLPHREKHDTQRSGMNWLAYISADQLNVVKTMHADDAEKKKKGAKRNDASS